MAEQVDLPAPIPKPSQTRWKLANMFLDPDHQAVRVQVRGDAGEAVTADYTTPAPPNHPSQPTGQQLLSTLNTANLTNNSLVRRVLNRLIADGYITGTVSGAPD